MSSVNDQPAGSGDPGKGRILIVDDVADNRAILGRRFQRRGYLIAEAESGAGALEMIDRETFDTVLLDVMMPDMNGLEVLRRIRERHSLDELPVIMVTGKTESQDVVDALTAGANDYITKPVDFAVALLRVSTQVARRQAEEQLRLVNAELNRANDELEQKIAARTAELVRTNEQLRRAMDEAQAANRAKDEFLVIVSHELRTPLNGLVGMGQMLAMAQLDERQRRMVDVINGSANELHAVVADLLDALDLRSGRMRLTPQPVEIAKLLQDAVDAAKLRAEAKGLAFAFEAAADLPVRAEIDGARLRQVLDKLLDNAVKFTAHGQITIAAGPASDQPDRLRITVRDTGVGFDEAAGARLFRPFEQADSSLSRPFGGLGLGLSICAGLVELMGGAITAEGAPGEGACFTLDVPLAPPPER
jgi:signal transduction histidine kinase